MIVNDVDKPSLDELTHHGVKGMKWGVRREYKRNVREANAKVTAYTREVGVRSSYALREISEEEYKSLSSTPIKLGKDFKRVGDETGNLRDIVYVSKDEEDHRRYTAVLAPGGNNTSRNFDDKKFDLTIKTSKEAISPSFKERIDTYIKTLDQKVPTENGKETKTGREILFENNSAAKALNTRELGLRTYQSFAQTQVLNKSVQSAYFDNLRKKGYTAIVDDADRNVISKLPIIIFPKESGARVTEIKPITKEDMLFAKQNIKLLN